MAKNKSYSNRPVLVSIAHHLPTLAARRTGALPKHLQVGVYFGGDEITMHFHTAGTDAIWGLPVTVAARNERLVKGLDPEDALQLGLYYQRQVDKSRFKHLRDEIAQLTSTN